MNKLASVLNRSYNLKDIANYWEKTALKLNTIFVKEFENFDAIFEKFLDEWIVINDGGNVKKEVSKLKEIDEKGEDSAVKNGEEEDEKVKKEISKFKGLKKRIEEILGNNHKKVNIDLYKRNIYIPLVTKLMTELRESFLENRLRRYAYKHRLQLDWYTKTPRKWRSPVTYYKRKHRYIKKRFRKFSRFKAVHWYLPSYIYFDSRTLRAVFLHNPRPDEIRFSFKCSLPQIHAFYKGLGL